MPMSKSLTTGAVVALGLALFAAPALAQESMTTPPWGDHGPRITFGPEDKGILQLDWKGQFRMNVRDSGSGPDGDLTTTSFGFRRNRLALMGAWGEKVSVYFQTEFVEDQTLTAVDLNAANLGTEFQVLDAVARFNLSEGFKINVGKFKYNLSRENLEACEDPLTLDRSLFIRAPFVGTRSTGLAIWGNLFKEKFQYRLDAMEGRPAAPGTVAPDSALRYSARGHFTLLDPESGYGYKGTYLGQKKVLTVGGAYQLEPKVTYTDTVNRIRERDYKAWTVDGFFEYPMKSVGTVTLSGAYEDIDLGDAYLGANPDPGAIGLNGEKNGWYAKGGLLLPKTPLQFFGRFERWRFGLLSGVSDQMVDWWGAGANYYVWGQNLKITGEFSHTKFDKPTTSAPDGSFNTFVAQMQFIF
jgi:hypothetical protein